MAEQKEEVSVDELKHANISLILDSYNDIFSSFDARGFVEKSLSVDFLDECKRAARDKDETELEIILSLPKNKRNLNDEFKIKKRLKDHFKHHAGEKEQEIKKLKKGGLKWMFSGFIALLVAVGVRTILPESLIVDTLVEPLLVIPGWFTIWEGLNRVLVGHAEKEQDLEFYKKMSNAQVVFRGY